MDLMKFSEVAAAECVRQQVGPDRLAMLINAFLSVRNTQREDITFEIILHIAETAEPKSNGRLRVTPVTFSNGGTSANHQDIERLLNNLITNGDLLSVDEWIKEFLWIHPFNDGNGRTGWILYNIFNGTMDQPVALPIYF